MAILNSLPRLALLSAIALVPLPAQSPLRTVTVGGTGAQPKYTLQVSAKGADGLVDVRDASGAKVQTLTCALDVPQFAPEFLAAHPDAPQDLQSFLGKLFVDELVAEDLNFDDYADLKGPREYASKFENYCVWIFDPRSHTFMHDGLAKQMEELSNLAADPKRQRITQGVMMGNFGFSLDEYIIDRGADSPRLVPLQSCYFSNSSESDITLSLTEYPEGQPAATHTLKASRPDCEVNGEGLCDCIREKIRR